MENQNNTTATQEAIILKYLEEGDITGVGKIAENYTQYLKNFLRTMNVAEHTINDVLQDVFLNLCVHLQKHDSLKLEHLRSYLGRTAINCLANYQRKEKKSPKVLTFEENFSSTNTTELNNADPEKTLMYLVKKLPKKQREIFCLKYFYKLNNEEICEQLKMNLGAVKISYFHAKKTISYYLLQN